MDTNTWLARRWWLVPVAVVIIGGSAGTNLGPGGVVDPGVAARFLAVVLAAAAALSLLALDRWPTGLLATGALSGGYFAVGGENGPIFFALIVGAFVLATGRPVRGWLPVLGAAAVLLWAGLLVRGLRWDDVVVGTWQGIGVGALVAAATAIGTSLRHGRSARVDRTTRAAAEERLRMAQDLHDGVGHGLAVIAMQAGVALHVLDRDPAKARESLEAIRTTSREALDALRTELATMAGEPAPWRPAPGAEAIPALVDRVRAAGLRVEVLGDPGVLDPAVGETAYALLQEALTNVLRHAFASTALVTWERGAETVALRVSDDGRGGAVQDEGMGISGMRARVAAVGGSFRAGPATGGGFEVAAVLPA
ncbi:signal transduction histidine kinase [Nocardioides sp. J9]|uniref:sensor histidine kinase n=1 Tax=Nocardioides sp. J9 TaxID=935844 RepID=UPI0011AC5105|nr:sensor histidine kinase [Nocardioides sp. J9]TWH01972.1 signal transduction histidine kinase [Nocardioides sp. J9]